MSLAQKLVELLEVHPPQSLSQNLRRMLLDYLSHELRSGIPNYMHDLLWQLSDLFELLDDAAQVNPGEEEQKQEVDTVPPATELLHTTIIEFFRIWDLPGFEKKLFEMLRRSLTNEGDETSALDRSDMIFLYERILELAKFCHTHHQNHKQLTD